MLRKHKKLRAHVLDKNLDVFISQENAFFFRGIVAIPDCICSF